MSVPKKRNVAAVCGDGHIRLIKQDVPAMKAGAVLVEVHASLVSPGTELGGWQNLAAQRKSPAACEPRPFGYSNAGVVVQVGEGVTEFKVGGRVACIGGGYAMHTDYAVVPHHLCVALPARVTFAQGSYAMLLATALHTVRRGEPELGESVAVVGLGLVGQLTAQLYHAAGNFVIGWDRIGRRLEIAKRWGIDATAAVGSEDEAAVTRSFTRGYGLDAAVLANMGECDATVDNLVKCMKLSPDGHPMGRIMVVGWPTFKFANLIGGMNNIDIRRCSRTGPGYHDEPWEYGPAYPPVFMRWTTRTNLELCFRLVAEGRVNVDLLTTHTIPLAKVEDGVEAVIGDPDSILGVVFSRS